MGMVFDSVDVPDFGSIYCSRLRGGATFKGVNEYGLNAEDVEKLDLITNAAYGSTAFCVDTCDIYVLMNDGWAMVGGDESASRSVSLERSVIEPIDEIEGDTR